MTNNDDSVEGEGDVSVEERMAWLRERVSRSNSFSDVFAHDITIDLRVSKLNHRKTGNERKYPRSCRKEMYFHMCSFQPIPRLP